jgi:transcriptional antiterminator RfaH
MNWYAIYIKPNCEDSTTLQLRKAGIEVLNPKIKIKKYVRGKYVRVTEPLFPSYLFARFDCESHGHMIKYTRGVRYVVGKQNPLVVPMAIIDMIQEKMRDDIVTPAPEKFENGERVLVKEGPFENFYGIFKRDIPGKERAMILLEALHCKLEIESVSLRKA